MGRQRRRAYPLQAMLLDSGLSGKTGGHRPLMMADCSSLSNGKNFIEADLRCAMAIGDHQKTISG